MQLSCVSRLAGAAGALAFHRPEHSRAHAPLPEDMGGHGGGAEGGETPAAGLEGQVCCQRLSVPVDSRETDSITGGPTTAEQICLGRAPAPQLVCGRMFERDSGSWPQVVRWVRQGCRDQTMLCPHGMCSDRLTCRSRGNWQVGAAFEIELLLWLSPSRQAVACGQICTTPRPCTAETVFKTGCTRHSH